MTTLNCVLLSLGIIVGAAVLMPTLGALVARIFIFFQDCLEKNEQKREQERLRQIYEIPKEHGLEFLECRLKYKEKELEHKYEKENLEYSILARKLYYSFLGKSETSISELNKELELSKREIELLRCQGNDTLNK